LGLKNILTASDPRCRLPSVTLVGFGETRMTIPNQPEIKIKNSENYRDSYSNSVQVRVNVWDFFLVFGTLVPIEDKVEVHNFQGIYLSPQQAKALATILAQNIANYEQTFGEIKLDPKLAPGPIH
jgi:flagellar protein FlaG